MKNKKSPEKKGWKHIPLAGMITEAGSAEKYETGSWRTFRPQVDISKCIHCLFFWVYCPDSSIVISTEGLSAKDVKMIGFDFEHCKGCGICASVCPKKCITMEKD